MLLSVLAVIFAGLSFNLGLVLQALDARRLVVSLAERPLAVAGLLRRPAWVAGTVLTIAGSLLEIAALRSLPVAFVAPVISAAVLIVPFAGALILHEPLQAFQLRNVTISLAGVVLLVAVTHGRVGRTPHGAWTVALVCAALPLAAAGLARARSAEPSCVQLACVAGVSYAATTVLFQLIALSHGRVAVLVPTFAALAVAGAIGFVAEQAALQSGSPTVVGPVVLAIDTALPVVLAPLIFAEHWSPLGWTLVAVAVTLFGTVLVSRASGPVLDAHVP